MDKKTTFSQRFTELRKLKGLTQDTAAKVFNVSRSAIGMWEQGKRIPSIDDLESIADYFNVDISFLLGRENTTTRLLSSDELFLIQKYRELDDDSKKFLKDYLNDLSALYIIASGMNSPQAHMLFSNSRSRLHHEQDSLLWSINEAIDLQMILRDPPTILGSDD